MEDAGMEHGGAGQVKYGGREEDFVVLYSYQRKKG